jgi:hypothetical protein
MIGWIKSGEWQPVPFFALFLNEQSQSMLRVYDRLQPLALVPSWGSTDYLEQQASAVARSALGLRKIVTWVLELPLIVPLIISGFALFLGCGWAAEEAKGTRR